MMVILLIALYYFCCLLLKQNASPKWWRRMGSITLDKLPCSWLIGHACYTPPLMKEGLKPLGITLNCTKKHLFLSQVTELQRFRLDPPHIKNALGSSIMIIGPNLFQSAEPNLFTINTAFQWCSTYPYIRWKNSVPVCMKCCIIIWKSVTDTIYKIHILIWTCFQRSKDTSLCIGRAIQFRERCLFR